MQVVSVEYTTAIFGVFMTPTRSLPRWKGPRKITKTPQRGLFEPGQGFPSKPEWALTSMRKRCLSGEAPSSAGRGPPGTPSPPPQGITLGRGGRRGGLRHDGPQRCCGWKLQTGPLRQVTDWIKSPVWQRVCSAARSHQPPRPAC